MSDLHKEINFENDICTYLAAHGWLYAEGDATRYDRSRALFPADVIAWVQATQPMAWESLTKNHGPAAEATLLERIRKQLDDRGTLEVLRHGVELLGLRQPLSLARFKPALAMNPDLQATYAANRLRVVRQVKYSLHNENCIDLVLFLNGIPVATVELKSDFTQSVQDAVDQYRFDRNPKPKGQPAAEPLLDFPRGALVHFAVSNSEVMMTTRLQGAATKFLPFNRGDDGGAGNPPSPLAPLPEGEGKFRGGHRTAYLWETVWQRESWLEIIGRYLVVRRNDRKQITAIIFPRYHQLDATRSLLVAVLVEGAGRRYLIQHSAGSGKTNSIAWAAHFLADLHDADNNKLFDTVLVVSDRNVLDAQLREAIFDFERTAGVVATTTGESASKSGELAAALSGGKKVVVCTIQTFPFALAAVQELAATQGKRFAVIADEAHSSQTGTAAAKLKAVLSADEIREQTLSRLNRAHPGKDTTYILDFVNDPEEILSSFKPYFETAELTGVTDPNLVYDLRSKLDASGHYDENEVERVVSVDMNPTATQAELSAAVEPVADRLLKQFKAAQARSAIDAGAARNEQNELILFKRNLGTFLRVYSFLSQIYDYGNSAIEKRALFYRWLLPLLDFGRERPGVDLSKVVLTHHRLRDQGKRDLALAGGARLYPLGESGSGEVREKEVVWLEEIITRVNELFEGELTDDDKLVYVNNVLKGKLLESERVRNGLKAGRLWESLRERRI